MQDDLFITALEQNDHETIRKIPKSDIHNHSGRGGSIKYISSLLGIDISPPTVPFESLTQFSEWFTKNIKNHFPDNTGYFERLEAAFVQANDDCIHKLIMCFDAPANLGAYIHTVENLHSLFAPDSAFSAELALARFDDTETIYGRLEEILSYGWYKSIDINCGEFDQPIQNFKKIYRLAKKAGLVLKAHVGEFGNAESILEAVEELELEQVHHGISAVQSDFVMKYLAREKIQLNICPTSNVMLKRVESYAKHPIRILYDYGIPVTINTDDMLIFNQSVSQEYMNLYASGLMTAKELDHIRRIGLGDPLI